MTTYSVTPAGAIQRSDGAFIPADPANMDYVAYQAWLAAGNTPAAAPSPAPAAPASTMTSFQFLELFTPQEQMAIQNACNGNVTLMVGLMTGIASGTVNVTDPSVSTWVNALVTSGALTQARATQVLTP